MRATWLLAAVLATAGLAHAQSTDVPGLVKVIETQPSDMDRTAWKEKRRDAAKKLGQSKDKRATPELVKLAETETFDIIGEIAIEGLGNLGDQAAVPTLQKIAGDISRDKTQRDLAKKALAKLGASADVAPPATTGTGTGLETGAGTGSATGSGTSSGSAAPAGGGDTGTAAAVTTGGTSSPLLGTKPTEDIPAPPELPDDTLAAYDRLTFAAGTASLGYDTVRKRLDFDADVAGLYQKRIEREKMAWGVDLAAHVVTGVVNPEGRGQSRGAQVNATADSEARFYSGSVYGIGKAAFALQLNYLSYIDANDASGGSDVKETRTYLDGEVALGGGYGRLLDVGAAIRVRRLARALESERALGRPIDAAVARKLQLTWWSLRGERSTYRALVATVAILREAGILLGEPDAGLTYEILNVLRDTQLYLRPSGLDLQLTFGEGYLSRPTDPMNVISGRVEQLLASAGYGSQLDDDKLEVSGAAFARLRVFAPDMSPSPWAIGGTARMRRFTYGEHGDPFGAFDLSGDVALSSDDRMNTQKSLHVGGELGFTYWLNQAAGIRIAGQVAEDQGALFIGGQLQATYGLLDGTFAR